MVVSLDPKERYCGCGGVGTWKASWATPACAAGFSTWSPTRCSPKPRQGDQRCAEFAKRWHRALAAATATSIHLEGPGKFYITGHNARFIDIERLNIDLQDMVRMSSLQGSLFEIVPTSDEIAIVGPQ